MRTSLGAAKKKNYIKICIKSPILFILYTVFNVVLQIIFLQCSYKGIKTDNSKNFSLTNNNYAMFLWTGNP